MGMMSKLGVLAAVVLVGGAATVVSINGRTDASSSNVKASGARAANDTPPDYLPRILQQPSDVDKATEQRVMNDAARTAWSFISSSYSSQTGFVNANPTWPYPTVWDIASSIAAYYSAKGLGLITEADYRARTQQALQTLKKVRLYHGIAYGRNYNATNGELVGLDQKPSENGTGYSSMDLGRLLIWLKIIEQTDPQLAPLARDAAHRLNASALIKNGYLQGEQVTKQGTSKYQEGRLGYEQYAAKGFDLWGMHASNALNMRANARRVVVKGIPVLTDKRGLDRLTSEPFIMQGLELGLSGDMRELALQTLALQAKRYEETGQVTIASEDALNDAPYYFYYYCVYCSGKAYAIEVHKPGVDLDAPRWVSAKAAYAWHAIMPSKYTWLAVRSVDKAQVPGKGWATGVYEKTGKSTEVMALNTAAVILESALYYKTGQPLINR